MVGFHPFEPLLQGLEHTGERTILEFCLPTPCQMNNGVTCAGAVRNLKQYIVPVDGDCKRPCGLGI